jgi:hypothetical protein
MTDAKWYVLLTEAQAFYYNEFAAHFPAVLMGAPTALSTADSGATYTFSSSIQPLALEVYNSVYRLLRPGAFWDTSADYVWEGNKIRFPKGVTKPDTYYARYVSPPDVVAAGTQPTLVPSHTRLLMVYRAVAQWAIQGNLNQAAYFKSLETETWFGNPAQGRVGVLGALKTQNLFAGGAAYQMDNGILGTVGAGYIRVS